MKCLVGRNLRRNFGSTSGLKTLLLVGVGLGAGSFFFWRWFGVVPPLPRFFPLHNGFSRGFFMTFCFCFLLNIFSSQIFHYFLFSFGGMDSTGNFDRCWCYIFFFSESYMVVLRGMQMVT